MSDVTSHSGQQRDLKRWENGLETIDITKQSRELNKDLVGDFGRDKLNYKPELYGRSAVYWAQNEARMAHGYPGTAWLQVGLLYGVGLYTAKQQGLVKSGVVFSKFWNFHYFDWITFIRRGGIYAIGGGLIAGTVLFGSPDLSIRRAINKYKFYCHAEKINIRGDYGNPMNTKF